MIFLKKIDQLQLYAKYLNIVNLTCHMSKHPQQPHINVRVISVCVQSTDNDSLFTL